MQHVGYFLSTMSSKSCGRKWELMRSPPSPNRQTGVGDTFKQSKHEPASTKCLETPSNVLFLPVTLIADSQRTVR